MEWNTRVVGRQEEGDRAMKIYFSAHEYMPIKFGVDYEIPEDTDFDIVAPVTPGECCEKYVEGGCYHLFVHSDDAYRDAQFLIENCMWLYTSPDSNKCEKKYTYHVVKAIVPKGTKYIKGTYGIDEAICVRKVRYETPMDKYTEFRISKLFTPL